MHLSVQRAPARRIEDLQEPPVIGTIYDVPTVEMWEKIYKGGEISHYTFLRLVPVIGPEHEDAEHINFPYDHWHIDWRFATKGHWKEETSRMTDFRVLAVVAIRGSESVIRFVRGNPFRRRWVCKRPMPQWPPTDDVKYSNVRWMKGLENEYAGCPLKPGQICPHRGVPLATLPADSNGVVTCPGHGLAFNRKTGQLVKRTSPDYRPAPMFARSSELKTDH